MPKRSLKDDEKGGDKRTGSVKVAKNGPLHGHPPLRRDKSSSFRPPQQVKVGNNQEKDETGRFRKKIALEDRVNESKPAVEGVRMNPEELAAINNLVKHNSQAEHQAFKGETIKHPATYSAAKSTKVDTQSYEHGSGQKTAHWQTVSPVKLAPLSESATKKLAPVQPNGLEVPTTVPNGVKTGAKGQPPLPSKPVPRIGAVAVDDIEESFEFDDDDVPDDPHAEPSLQYMLDSFMGTKR